MDAQPLTPEATYHAADNSFGSILGGLFNTAVGVGAQLVTDKLTPKKEATQQVLKTPGEKPVAGKPAFNWKPFAIGGAILAAIVGAFLIFRNP